MYYNYTIRLDNVNLLGFVPRFQTPYLLKIGDKITLSLDDIKLLTEALYRSTEVTTIEKTKEYLQPLSNDQLLSLINAKTDTALKKLIRKPDAICSRDKPCFKQFLCNKDYFIIKDIIYNTYGQAHENWATVIIN